MLRLLVILLMYRLAGVLLPLAVVVPSNSAPDAENLNNLGVVAPDESAIPPATESLSAKESLGVIVWDPCTEPGPLPSAM
jgi:hypothetical protein